MDAYCSIGPKTNLAYLLSQTDKIKQIVSMSMALPRPNKVYAISFGPTGRNML